jgi:hypothetical protein
MSQSPTILGETLSRIKRTKKNGAVQAAVEGGKTIASFGVFAE